MRTLAILICLVSTSALAEAPITIHPFELTTRGDELDGKTVATHCIMVGATSASAVCLAPNGFGDIDVGAEIDLNFETINNLFGGFADELDHAQRHCAGHDLNRTCRITVTGTARYGRAFPAMDVMTLSFPGSYQ